jgi:acetyl-CoA acetyltransferase
MNYDLAMMALDGLARAPLTIETRNGAVVISGAAASFKELARLCLLMGGAEATAEDSFELQPGRHVTRGSAAVTLRLG